MLNPAFSFVVTARNDNYGGNLLNRASTFVRVLDYLAEKYKLPIEIVWIEYNPIPDKPYLFQELPRPTTEFLQIRSFVVPKEFHDKVRQNNIPVLEYIAKNIGIRRARGTYTIATNPDIIFSEELFRHFKNGSLDTHHFYRADRNDIFQNRFPENMSPEKIIAKAARHVTKILYTPRTHYISYWTWLHRLLHDRRLAIISLCPLFNYRHPPNRNMIYENASGDFLMAHKDVWEKAHGYDQTPHNLHHDSLMLYVLEALGYMQEILSGPVYHIHHDLGRAGRPGIEMIQFREIVKKMRETKIPHIVNGPDWGFPKEQFEEVRFTA